MDGRSRTSEVEDLVHFDEERVRDVVPEELEVLVVEQMLDIPAGCR